MPGDAQRRLGQVDLFYGLVFLALLVVGLARAYWYEKGGEYYLTSPTFWGKMGALAAITVFGLPPTFVYLRWGRTRRSDPEFRPSAHEVRSLRRYLWAQAMIYPLVGLFAAMMARGL